MPVDMRLSTPRKVSHSWRILQLARQPCWSEQPAHETGPRHQTIRGHHAALMTIGGEWKLYGRRQRAGAKLQGNFTGRHACLSATKLRAIWRSVLLGLSLSSVVCAFPFPGSRWLHWIEEKRYIISVDSFGNRLISTCGTMQLLLRLTDMMSTTMVEAKKKTRAKMLNNSHSCTRTIFGGTGLAPVKNVRLQWTKG